VPDLFCSKCKEEYNITEEYIDAYGIEGKRCGCGEMMEIPKEGCEECLMLDEKTLVCFKHGQLDFIPGLILRHENCKEDFERVKD
jgi:hypothetical protein